MILRRYRDEDCNAVSKLFYETVHTVNAKDYTAEQLCAWAHGEDSLQAKHKALMSQHTVIAEIDGKIVGFGSIDKFGCLDMLFVHKDFQRQGIATAICDELEAKFSVVKTYASITAKPFFEKRGYSVMKEQSVERQGIFLTNYRMEKKR